MKTDNDLKSYNFLYIFVYILTFTKSFCTSRYAGDDYYFIINRAKLEDRGEYIIRAENHYGFREEVVFLNVQRKLHLDIYVL